MLGGGGKAVNSGLVIMQMIQNRLYYDSSDPVLLLQKTHNCTFLPLPRSFITHKTTKMAFCMKLPAPLDPADLSTIHSTLVNTCSSLQY